MRTIKIKLKSDLTTLGLGLVPGRVMVATCVRFEIADKNPVTVFVVDDNGLDVGLRRSEYWLHNGPIV